MLVRNPLDFANRRWTGAGGGEGGWEGKGPEGRRARRESGGGLKRMVSVIADMEGMEPVLLNEGEHSARCETMPEKLLPKLARASSIEGGPQ